MSALATCAYLTSALQLPDSARAFLQAGHLLTGAGCRALQLSAFREEVVQVQRQLLAGRSGQVQSKMEALACFVGSQLEAAYELLRAVGLQELTSTLAAGEAAPWAAWLGVVAEAVCLIEFEEPRSGGGECVGACIAVCACFHAWLVGWLVG